MCLTKGQWLQIKATSSGLPAKSLRETCLPSVSGRRKSPAVVPSGAIVEGVAGIEISSFMCVVISASLLAVEEMPNRYRREEPISEERQLRSRPMTDQEHLQSLIDMGEAAYDRLYDA